MDNITFMTFYAFIEFLKNVFIVVDLVLVSVLLLILIKSIIKYNKKQKIIDK